MPKELKALTDEQGTDLMAEAMFNIRNELLRVEHETDGDTASVTPSDTSEPEGQELVYAAHISLDRTSMQVEDRSVNLAPGMAVTAEIKTGQRRVIEYLLSPLMRYGHESLRER